MVRKVVLQQVLERPELLEYKGLVLHLQEPLLSHRCSLPPPQPLVSRPLVVSPRLVAIRSQASPTSSR